MKQLLYAIIFTINFNTQSLSQCLSGPNMNFSGTKIAWSYQVEDPLMDTTLCQDEVKFYQRANLWVKPLEYDDKFITVFANGHSGTVINAMDKTTGSILWQKVYNHTNTEETRGFRCPFIKKLNGDSLELLGFRSYYSYEPNKQFSTSTQGGFPNKIVISHKTGTQLGYLSVKGFDLRYQVGFGSNDQPDKINNEDIYYSYGFFPSNKIGETLQWSHSYTNTKSLLKYFTFPPFNELPDKAAKTISFDHSGPNMERPIYNLVSERLKIDTNLNLCLFSFKLNEKYYHHAIKMDDWGNFISDTDITEQISKEEKILYWDEPEIVKGNKIRLQCRVPKTGFYEFGHHGYVELDFDGNLIKDNKQMVIDGFRPIFLKTIDLQNSDELLHIFRPQENNNIYFYKEKANGSFVKAGELINNNRSVYAFQPVIATQAKDGDLLVEFSVLLDSIIIASNSFNTGGWGALIKIEAEELGITVSTDDPITQEKISLYPNPTNDKFRIECQEKMYPLDISIFDISGKSIHKQLLLVSDEIDIENLPNGIYNVKMQSIKRDIPPQMAKIVKIE
jgi:hypothetical protein